MMTYVCLGGPLDGKQYAYYGEAFTVPITKIVPSMKIEGKCIEPFACESVTYKMSYINGLGFWIAEGMTERKILEALCGYLLKKWGG